MSVARSGHQAGEFNDSPGSARCSSGETSPALGSRFTRSAPRLPPPGNGAPTATVPYGGVAAGYFITFENGWTTYFSGSSAAMAEQGLWAQMYKPDLAILHMGNDHEPLDFAQQAKLLRTENPNLKTIFPHHNRVTPPAGATTVADVQAAMDAMGVGLQVTQPHLGEPVSFP